MNGSSREPGFLVFPIFLIGSVTIAIKLKNGPALMICFNSRTAIDTNTIYGCTSQEKMLLHYL